MLHIYLPGQGKVGNGLLEEVGLGHLTRNAPQIHWREVLQHGPDAVSGGTGYGMLASWGKPSGVFLKEQTWRPAVPDGELPAGRYWVGLPKFGAAPVDLARPYVTESKAVELDDGRLWQIPVARELPHESRLDPETGQLVRRVSEQYREYYQLAEAFFGAVLQRQGAGLRMHDAWRLARLGLEINYLVTPEVIDELQIARTDDTLFWIAGASFELQDFVEIERQKKKTARTPAT